MVHRGDAALGACIAQHRVQIETAVAYAPVHKLRHPKYIEVTMKGSHLAARNQQQMIEEGLQLAQLFILRVRVVVGDGDEIQTARCRCLYCQKEGTRHIATALAPAASVAMRGVHMEIAAIPARSRGEGLGGESRIFCSRVKAYIRLVVGNHLWAHVRNRDDQPPFSGRDRSRKIRRSGIRFADGEVALVSAALTTKTLWVRDAEVQGSALIFPGVLKVNTDTVYAGRHCERDLEVGLVLRAFTSPVSTKSAGVITFAMGYISC